MSATSRGRELLGTDERPWIVFALVVAVVGTAGSLYYSLGWRLLPCRLCWYQRILLYPQVMILGYAALTRKPDIYRVVLPMTLLGGGIAAYHSWLQLQPPGTCLFLGCGAVQYRFAGLLTIPNQSLLAFLAITAAMVGLAVFGPGVERSIFASESPQNSR